MKLRIAIVGLVLSQALFLWLLRYDIGLLRGTSHTIIVPVMSVQHSQSVKI